MKYKSKDGICWRLAAIWSQSLRERPTAGRGAAAVEISTNQKGDIIIAISSWELTAVGSPWLCARIWPPAARCFLAAPGYFELYGPQSSRYPRQGRFSGPESLVLVQNWRIVVHGMDYTLALSHWANS